MICSHLTRKSSKITYAKKSSTLASPFITPSPTFYAVHCPYLNPLPPLSKTSPLLPSQSGSPRQYCPPNLLFSAVPSFPWAVAALLSASTAILDFLWPREPVSLHQSLFLPCFVLMLAFVITMLYCIVSANVWASWDAELFLQGCNAYVICSLWFTVSGKIKFTCEVCLVFHLHPCTLMS